MGSGDATAINFENEFRVSIIDYISTGLSFNYGRGLTSRYLFSSSFIQGNLNIFGELFPKSKLGLSLGGGISLFDLNEVSVKSGHYETGEFIADDYYFKDYTTVGYNLIIEPRVNITNRLLIRLRLIAQLYENGDTNAGGILKLGYRFN